jgi:hypothetical protein
MSNFFHQLEVLSISSVSISNDVYTDLWSSTVSETVSFDSSSSLSLSSWSINSFDADYLHANRWQELIAAHIPRLRIFDFQWFGRIDDSNHDYKAYHTLIDGFHSLFWITHGWFFAHQHYQYDNSSWAIFYSVNPYRHNSQYQHPEYEACVQAEKSFESARHITISNPSTAVNYSYRLANISRLNLLGRFYKNNSSFISDLSRIIPLAQITELVLICDNLSMIQLTELLRLSFSLQSLTLMGNTRCPIIEEDETVHSINKKNTKEIPNRGKLTLKHVQTVVEICPHLQYLEMTISENYLERIMRFLLLQNVSKTRRLCMLGIRDAHYGMIRRLHKMINVEKLIDDYSLQHISNTAYLW